MKKKFLAIVICIALIASLSVGLTACKKDNDNKASNTEAIGTAVAMIAGSATSATTTADGGSQESGFNFKFDTNMSAAMQTTLSGSMDMVKSVLDGMVQQFIDGACRVANENAISVETKSISSTDTRHAEYNTQLVVKATSKDENGEDVVTTYNVYLKAVKADKTTADINGTDDYTFTALVEVGDSTISFTGTAKYDKEDKVTKFVISIPELDNLTFELCANDDGGIDIEFNMGSNTSSLIVDIEVGKLDNNKYGADVEVNIAVGTTFSAEVEIEIYADNSKDAQNDFILSGDAELKIVLIGSTYNLEAQLTGYANYEYDTEEQDVVIDFALSGALKAESNNNDGMWVR